MSGSTPTVSPFTKVVVSAMRTLYPEKLADSSFDNTGLLLEAPYRPGLKNSVLLTVDLTKAVADEAIENRDSIVIAYHPIIFRGLKSLTLNNTQQNSLLRLAQEGISVYSPHTAVDAAPGGLNDWLVDLVIGYKASKSKHSISVITPVPNPPEGFEKAGYGRIIRFVFPETLDEIVKRVGHGLGSKVNGLSVATPQHLGADLSDIEISSVGICAGSGGSMLNGLDVDLLFTGELSHHEALAATEQEKCVITAFHSNTERGYLREGMAEKLHDQIGAEIKRLDGADGANLDSSVRVRVSEVDRDPYTIFVFPSVGL